MRNFQGSHTIFNIKVQGISRFFPGFNNKKKGDFRKSLVVNVFLTLEWGPTHQISVFQRCYIFFRRINITVHYKFAGTLMFDISACEIDN
jgi:hypothetical protein